MTSPMEHYTQTYIYNDTLGRMSQITESTIDPQNVTRGHKRTLKVSWPVQQCSRYQAESAPHRRGSLKSYFRGNVIKSIFLSSCV